MAAAGKEDAPALSIDVVFRTATAAGARGALFATIDDVFITVPVVPGPGLLLLEDEEAKIVDWTEETPGPPITA